MSDNSGVLIGYSGHGFVVAETAIQGGLNILYYVDLKEVSNNPFYLTRLAEDVDERFNGWDKKYQFILGIGNNQIRESIAMRLLMRKQIMPAVIHPSASLSDKITLGMGIFVARNASVNALAEIGDYAIINTAAVIEHECIIGTAAHIAPGAVLAGNVIVGDRTFIGANSVVKQGIKIGSDVIIGAGTVIIRDVPDGATMVGNPAKQIR